MYRTLCSGTTLRLESSLERNRLEGNGGKNRRSSRGHRVVIPWSSRGHRVVIPWSSRCALKRAAGHDRTAFLHLVRSLGCDVLNTVKIPREKIDFPCIYFTFVFTTVDRNLLWNVVSEVVCPPGFVNILTASHSGNPDRYACLVFRRRSTTKMHTVHVMRHAVNLEC